ncbi:peptidase [Ectothiorhodospira haloalkaliphila]|uniref:Peptidase n=1 Tax=Ectothiorhodospira haloalkaliphila TaxID=421628 RepID=W8KMP1_9GAMM|nr:peptidase [Ectothiorhodospira haloalkaliphila]
MNGLAGGAVFIGVASGLDLFQGKALYEKGSTKGVQQNHVKKLRRILANLDEAKESQDMDLPGYKLHELKGDREGFWSVHLGSFTLNSKR